MWRNFTLSAAMLLTTLGTVNSAEAQEVEIIAHRGASFDAPENTLESFQLGWEQQADAVELDLYLSKDGRIVVIHDANTKRLAGVDRLVADQTFDELRSLDVGKWKNANWTGTKIPLFSDVLKTIPASKRLFIEIKCGPEIIPELKRELSSAGRPHTQTAIIGFSHKTMTAVKQEFPNLQVFWIVDIKPKADSKSPDVTSLIAQAKQAGLDGLDLSAHEMIDREYATKILSSGLKLAVWTVNEPELARKMVAAGVQGITTDRPGWMREQLKLLPATK